MRLLNCYIENFGKLHNYKHEFKQGLNTIKEQNGFGKTTFATFIKSMFYGLDAGTNVKTEKSDRKKYMPWQGGNYGGNIEFEINNKKYRIERFFGKKQVEDTFKLYDLSTNLESDDYTENIGEEIFKINKAGYERSTYIPQGQIQIEMEDSISAKLGNVLESDNDVNSSDDAIKKLNETKKIYIKDKGKGGLIDEKKDRLNKLERALENSRSDIEVLESKKIRLNEINNKIKDEEILRDENQKQLSSKLEQGMKKAKQETYNTILNKYNQSKEKIDNLTGFFKNGVPDEAEIKNLTSKNYELEKTKNDIENNRISGIEAENIEHLKLKFNNITEDEIDQSIKNCYNISEIDKEIQIIQNQKNNMEQQKHKYKKVYIVLLIIGVIFTILGIVMQFAKFNQILAIAGIGIGVMIVAISFIFLFKSKNANYAILKRKIEDLNRSKEDMELQINKLCDSNSQDKILDLSNLKAEYNKYIGLLNMQAGKDEYLQKCLMKKNSLENELRSGLSKYYENPNNSYIELIQELNIKANEYNLALTQFDESKTLKEKFEQENNLDELMKIEDVTDSSEQELKEKNEQINKEIDKLVDEKNQIKNQIETLENKIDENEYIETDIENLKDEIEHLNNKYLILNKTEQLLKKAKESFSSSYLQDMIQGFNKYINEINDTELSTNVDINLNVKLDVNGSQKEVKYFSYGYKDLVYLCMRFSLIQTLFKDEKPFVVLDDPFVNLDDEKTAKALQIIEKFSKDYQILYFSCSLSRV